MPSISKPTEKSKVVMEYLSLTPEFPNVDNVNFIDDNTAIYA